MAAGGGGTSWEDHLSSGGTPPTSAAMSPTYTSTSVTLGGESGEGTESGVLTGDISQESPKLHESQGLSKVPLSRQAIVCYGTGHMLNDLTAACWFTYLLIFLTDINLSPREAGVVLMAGQLADAVATLVVGRMIDAFGHFKVWHAAGSVLVAISFSSVFGPPSVLSQPAGGAGGGGGENDSWRRTVMYATYAAIFNIGWAATQVSHMSLVNCITGNSSSRVALNSCRNAFTMVANLLLYIIALWAFETFPGTSSKQVQHQFEWIAMLSILLGSVFVVLFLCGISEPRMHHFMVGGAKTPWTYWFGQLLYYQVAIIYLLTRLATNVSQAILPFFLIDYLLMAPASKAVVPAVVYVSSLCASIALQELHWSGAKLKAVFTGGALFWVASGAAFFCIGATHSGLVYPLATLIGVANAFILVTATSMEGILVDRKLSGCAFVYGSLSFLDKLSCGLALFFIQSLLDCSGDDCGPSTLQSQRRGHVVRWVLSTVPSGCALIAAIVAIWTDLRDDHERQMEEHARCAGSICEPLLPPPACDYPPPLPSPCGSALAEACLDKGSGGVITPLTPPPPFGEGLREFGVVSAPQFVQQGRGHGSVRLSRGSDSDSRDAGTMARAVVEIQVEDVLREDAGEAQEVDGFLDRMGNAMVGRWGSIRTQFVLW